MIHSISKRQLRNIAINIFRFAIKEYAQLLNKDPISEADNNKLVSIISWVNSNRMDEWANAASISPEWVIRAFNGIQNAKLDTERTNAALTLASFLFEHGKRYDSGEDTPLLLADSSIKQEKEDFKQAT